MPALLQEFEVPGVSIALISGPRVQWSAGYGQTGLPGSDVLPQTVFQVASLGKPVFAHLLDGIEAQREWELRDPLHLWSPSGAYPSARGILTAEELLSHTSGLRYDATHDQVVLDSAGRGQWSYSGAGYVLLQRALEAAEGRSLEELSGSILFGPLGLQTMTYVAPEGEQRAVGHDRSGNPLTGLDWEEASAASSLYASAVDYARFLIFAAGLDGSDPGAWTRLTQVRTTVDKALGLYWGLGWAVERDANGHRTGFHWGSNPGFKSFALLDPERQLGLVILTNGDYGLELVQRIVGILDPKPHPLFEFYMLHPDD
jgi:CubicO group peptidase (beta-lactamase class C family)